jgi:hypothetical protein
MDALPAQRPPAGCLAPAQASPGRRKSHQPLSPVADAGPGSHPQVEDLSRELSKRRAGAPSGARKGDVAQLLLDLVMREHQELARQGGGGGGGGGSGGSGGGGEVGGSEAGGGGAAQAAGPGQEEGAARPRRASTGGRRASTASVARRKQREQQQGEEQEDWGEDEGDGAGSAGPEERREQPRAAHAQQTGPGAAAPAAPPAAGAPPPADVLAALAPPGAAVTVEEALAVCAAAGVDPASLPPFPGGARGVSFFVKGLRLAPEEEELVLAVRPGRGGRGRAPRGWWWGVMGAAGGRGGWGRGGGAWRARRWLGKPRPALRCSCDEGGRATQLDGRTLTGRAPLLPASS